MAVSLPAFFTSLNHLMQRGVPPKFLSLWFLLCALPAGLGCALLSPIGTFPDELQHCARADGLRHGEIYGARPPPALADFWINGGVRVDNGIAMLFFSQEFSDASTGRPVTAADRHDAATQPWFAGRSYYPSQMVNYFPIMYAPGAFGLLAGQMLGLSPLHSFYAGRVAMLLVFLLLGTAAVGLARWGNGLIFAALTLPASINLASSYNQDGLIIGCSALAAALLSRGPGRAWVTALTVLTAVVSAKTPYAVFLLLCLPPLLAPGLCRRAMYIALACVLPALWLLHGAHTGFIAYKTAAYHPGALWPGPQDIMLQHIVPGDNLRVLLAHPAQILLLPLTSFAQDWPAAWQPGLGGIAWGNQRMGAWEYPCLAAALLAAASAMAGRGDETWRGPDAVFAALALFAAFIGMELALYLTWTKAGFAQIDGVQPRYFIPFLPFLIFLLPAVTGRLPLRLGSGWLCLPAMAMAGVNAFALPASIFHLFQMPGP